MVHVPVITDCLSAAILICRYVQVCLKLSLQTSYLKPFYESLQPLMIRGIYQSSIKSRHPFEMFIQKEVSNCQLKMSQKLFLQ